MKPDTRNPDSAARRIVQDPRWAAVIARDSQAADQFVYAVKTTGIYCRPGSASRLPRPENVEFFDTPRQAEAAGYRPSGRSRDDGSRIAGRHAELAGRACRYIEAADHAPSLAELARFSGLSAYHFHRIFKAVTGVTPKSYVQAHRNKAVRKQLEEAPSVTQAIYDAGFNSNSRFYEASGQVLGMRPGSFRRGGEDAEIRFAVAQCSLGAILVAQSRVGVCAISFGDDPDALVRDLQDKFPRANLIGADREFERTIARVIGFVETPALGLDLPLDVRGTAFQRRVWEALREIPAGSRVTYSQIAARIGAPRAVRAVAGACAANVLAVAIPCHRVVRTDGSLSGYRWGVPRKRALLEREAGAAGPGNSTA